MLPILTRSISAKLKIAILLSITKGRAMNRRSFITSAAAFAGATIFPFNAFAGGKSGKFSGDSNHVAKGTVTVENGKIMLQDSFWFDGAPDPRIGLGKTPEPLMLVKFPELKKKISRFCLNNLQA